MPSSRLIEPHRELTRRTVIHKTDVFLLLFRADLEIEVSSHWSAGFLYRELQFPKAFEQGSRTALGAAHLARPAPPQTRAER